MEQKVGGLRAEGDEGSGFHREPHLGADVVLKFGAPDFLHHALSGRLGHVVVAHLPHTVSCTSQ
jgi:hypothetical protein